MKCRAIQLAGGDVSARQRTHGTPAPRVRQVRWPLVRTQTHFKTSYP